MRVHRHRTEQPHAGDRDEGQSEGGEAVFSAPPADFVLDAFAGTIAGGQVDEDLDRLTEREREVMRLIARAATPAGRSPAGSSDTSS